MILPLITLLAAMFAFELDHSFARNYMLIYYFTVSHQSLCSCCREGPEFSYGLNWALAGRAVIIKDKAFHNLGTTQLQKNGATRVGCT